ncbi:hypothetical protein Q8A73_012667 [Channa argus]|nr:hypothetical protein Q8A73_012667 [Channa argus]
MDMDTYEKVISKMYELSVIVLTAMNMLLLLVVQLQLSYSLKDDAGFPQVFPNRQQHFEHGTINVSCEGLNGLKGWRVLRRLYLLLSISVSVLLVSLLVLMGLLQCRKNHTTTRDAPTSPSCPQPPSITGPGASCCLATPGPSGGYRL